MKLVVVILDDRELDRLLTHQGCPTRCPACQTGIANKTANVLAGGGLVFGSLGK